MAVGAAVDNDVLLKAASYRVTSRLWPSDALDAPGVLGAARFVLADVLKRGSRVRDQAGTQRELAELFGRAVVLEPTDDELAEAAELERLAQRAGLEIDAGESQLAAMVAARGIPWLDTGDKRAVRAFDTLTAASPPCAELRKRVRCLEQLFLLLLEDMEDGSAFDAFAAGVCAEPDIDKAVSICFSCYSGGGAVRDSALAGLASYVGSLRSAAPLLLADGPSTAS
jgi:predicted nucleic acid-binding protein